jgi:hypothetical protein
MSINKTKLAILIPRLASDFDGEVVATVRAICRILAADGHDLHDLARVVSPAPPKAPMSRKAPNVPEDVDAIIAEAEDILKCTWLTKRERAFLESICDRARRRPGFKMSENQQFKFHGLARLTARARGRK